MKIKNNTRETMDFVVPGGTADHPKTESLKAGETRDIPVSPSSRQLAARRHAGSVTIEDEKPAARPPADREQPAATERRHNTKSDRE